jgi:hypothetical protein
VQKRRQIGPGGLLNQTLNPSGQVASNRMVITMLGVTVGSLDETIMRE